MKINDDPMKRNMRRPKKELADDIVDAQRSYGLKWRAGLKSKLRDKYRQHKKAKITLSMIGMRAQDRPMIQASILAMGSIQKRFNTCGKKDCPCSHGGPKHGPYWYLSLPMPASMVRKGSPRMRHFYITQEEAERLRERIENYRAIQEKVWFEIFDDFENGDKIDDLIEE